MKTLFRRNPGEGAGREIRRRAETRSGTMSPFGVAFNALKPLIS